MLLNITQVSYNLMFFGCCLSSITQTGFRRGKSTTGAVRDQMKYIYENFDERNIVISMFFGF